MLAKLMSKIYAIIRDVIFWRNSRAYDAWLAANAAELLRRVKWAEWQTVPKGRQ